jgi:hypothetical protein
MARVANVNTTDIAEAIRLGCQTMCAIFNTDDNGFPHFESRVRPTAYLAFSRLHGESHVPGRHLNALLNAEDACGVRVDEEAIETHARALFFSYSGPLPLPMNREVPGGRLVHFTPHNIREGFHGLYSLAAYRNSARARALAEASIAAVGRHWQGSRGWRIAEPGIVLPEEGSILALDRFIAGVARAIGPLVKYYRATAYGPALDLAILLKEHALEGYFPPDGAYLADRHGTHTHSTTCVMSSLAQLADLTLDARLMARVKAFYDNGLWRIRDELGWVIESAAPNANPDRGEVNNTGDILETALILGRWGFAECYEDAETILRGHLLPSQLRDTSFIVDPPNPTGEDGKRHVAQRHLGAFGFPAPYGHEPADVDGVGFNMDIVGGAVGSLCEAYREVASRTPAGIRVNLLFDHETADVEVRSPYTHGVLSVRAKRPGPLLVRIPPWLAADPSVQPEGVTARRAANGYLLIPEAPLNRSIEIGFALPERNLRLKHRTHDIRVRLHGSEVVAMDDFGADLTYFDRI